MQIEAVLKSIMEPGFVEELFDRLPDVVFFVKDRRARYVVVNRSLVERCGVRSKHELIGRTAEDIFPAPLGEAFFHQDLCQHTRLSGWRLRFFDKPNEDMNLRALRVAADSGKQHDEKPADRSACHVRFPVQEVE